MKEDEKWQALLLLSTPTFAGEETPSYGFITHTLARLKTEKRQYELMERIGLRAFLASLAVLGVSVCLTLCLHFENRNPGDLEPGLNSLIQAENVQVS